MPTCGSNEVYACQAPCVATCASQPRTCAGTCVNACYCKSGYVRATSNSSSPCIEVSKCPGSNSTNDSSSENTESENTESDDTESEDTESGDTESEDTESIDTDSDDSEECGENEEFNSCGSSCPKTCDDFAYPISTKPKICTAVCVLGCFCKSGYYKNKKGKCVKSSECCSGPNEVFKKRGPAVVETCTTKPNSAASESVSGCFCESSKYVRKGKKAKSPCVLRSKCSKRN